jgi:hypothetical protein
MDTICLQRLQHTLLYVHSSQLPLNYRHLMPIFTLLAGVSYFNENRWEYCFFEFYFLTRSEIAWEWDIAEWPDFLCHLA